MDERTDSAIERLDDALRAAGFEALAPAADPAAVEEVDAALAPYSLPPDLRRFWERVDFPSLRVHGWSLPEPCDPRGALAVYRGNQEPGYFPLGGPPLLFPFAAVSGDQWSVELASSWGPGGCVVSQPTGELRVAYPSFADLLEAYAELLEEGRFQRDGAYGAFPHEAERELQEARLRALDPLFGDPHSIGEDPTTWPAHWLESAGIDLGARAPQGRTRTIAEPAAAAAAGGSIDGTVVRLIGSSAGSLVTVEDGTGSIDIWCPAGTSPWGPVHGQAFEFDVAVEDGTTVASAIRPLG